MKGVCIWLLVTLQSYKTGLTSRSLGLCSFADNYPDNRMLNLEFKSKSISNAFNQKIKPSSKYGKHLHIFSDYLGHVEPGLKGKA